MEHHFRDTNPQLIVIKDLDGITMFPPKTDAATTKTSPAEQETVIERVVIERCVERETYVQPLRQALSSDSRIMSSSTADPGIKKSGVSIGVNTLLTLPPTEYLESHMLSDLVKAQSYRDLGPPPTGY